MKPKLTLLVLRFLAVSAAVPCVWLSAQGAQNTKPASAAETNAKRVAQQEIPRSVFVIPANPKEGRNPFFPYAVQPAPVVDSTGKNTNPGIDPSGFVLNGITSPPKRTAMINGRTFEPGESGEVRLKTGFRVLIKCEEITNDSAIITVGGKRVELRLRLGL